MSLTNTKVDGSDFTQPISAASLPLPTGASTAALQTQPGVDIGDVTINNSTGASAVNIQDGGNSITVDGSVTANAGTNLNTSALALDATLTGGTAKTRITDGTDNLDITAAGAAKVDGSAVTQPISAASLPLPTGASTAALQTQPGVDIGDVTVNNASGASAVNVQDGGNSLTVDGTVTANQGTANTAANGWPVKITDGTDTAIVDTDGSLFVKPVPVGTHGNAWNAATVSSGGNSAVIDCQYVSVVSIFGNSSNNLNPMRVQASMDNSNFYTLTTFAISTGNFGVTIDFGARYLRLQSGQGSNFTLTATVAGK